MNPKQRPNHQHYLRGLRKMTPEEKLTRVFELSAFARDLFLHRLHTSFPDATEEEFRSILKDCLIGRSQQEIAIWQRRWSPNPTA
jgi:hypothetical protein